MPARLNTRQSDKCRDAIKSTLLIKKLQNHALDGLEMLPSQIAAAKILLDKLVSNAPTEIMQTVDAQINIIINKP